MHQGILLEQCFDNSILQNNITGNLGYGIALLSSSNNTFCHNNITNSAHACGRHVFGKQEEQLAVLVGWIKLYQTKPKFQTSRHMAEGTIKAVSGAYTVQDTYCFL